MTTHLVQAVLDGLKISVERHPQFPTAVQLIVAYGDDQVTRTVDQRSILRDRADLLDGTIAILRNELADKLDLIPTCPHCCGACDQDLCFNCGLDPREMPRLDLPPVRPLGQLWTFDEGHWKRTSGPEAFLLQE